jgi:serine/threonine protein kinase
VLLEETPRTQEDLTSPLPPPTTEERCDICGLEIEESHACLQSIPASVLTLKDPRIGTVVVEHYVLEEFICDSSTSLVYKARHQLINGHVAVKLARAISTHDPFTVLRTSRAALIAAHLNHPNIVRCIEFSHDSDRNAVLVMEWANGTTLSQLIAREVSLTPLRALNLFEGLCDALRYAQTQGVNHINLKPNGIIVETVNGAEQARLLDFGLMKMLDPVDANTFVKSEHFKYSSPEEQAGQPPDQRSMIYSLGLILFDMLTGRVETLEGSSAANERIDVPPLVKIRPDLTEAVVIDKILSRCVAFLPSKRFQTLDDLCVAVSQARLEVERIERVERFHHQDDGEPNSFTDNHMTLLIVALCVCALFAIVGA